MDFTRLMMTLGHNKVGRGREGGVRGWVVVDCVRYSAAVFGSLLSCSTRRWRAAVFGPLKNVQEERGFSRKNNKTAKK